MKKFLLFTIVALCCSTVGNSKQLNETDAKSVADNFFVTKSTNGKNNIAGAPMKLAYKSLNSATGIEGAYYVFNRGLRNGYVVVAGDDLVTTPVLGYSENGSFHIDSIPDNMRYWLNEYQRQIEYLQEKGIQASPAQPKKWTTSVAPLLGETKWGQGSPYNLLCPTLSNGNNAVTGCTTTALSQIMYYWRWPDVGVGSVEYQYPNEPKYSADFSKSRYEWDYMTPVYNAQSSDQSKQAVAKLMTNVAHGVRASFGSSTSAPATRVATGMMDYFKYSKKMALYHRAHFFAEEWDLVLKDEIDAGRPVFYSGWTSENGGHAFVCDGYTSDGFFHFNWGWNGSYNGFFRSSSLNYLSYDIDVTYDFRQLIIKDICPNVEGTIEHGDLIMNSWSLLTPECNLGESVKISLENFETYHWRPMIYNIALNLYKGNELILSKEVAVTAFDYLDNIAKISGNIQLPKTLPNGEYRLYPQYKVPEETATNYTTLKMPFLQSRYMIVNVSDGKATIVKPSLTSNVTVKSFTLDEKVCTNNVSRAYVTLKNESETDYCNRLYVRITNSKNSPVNESLEQMVILRPGEENNYQFELPPISTAGDYKLTIKNENGANLATIDFSVQNAIGTPNLIISNHLSCSSSSIYNITASATIQNNGDFFNGNIEVMIYDDSRIHLRLYDYVALDFGSEKTVTFQGPFESGEIGKEYYMSLRRYDVTNKSQVWGKQVKFILEGGFSAINEVSTDEASAPVQYYNLQGIEVKNPEHGIFIRKQGNKVTKVIL